MSRAGFLGIRKTHGGDTDHWLRRWSMGRRVAVEFHLMRHNNPTLTPRWVFRPSFVYDKKGARGY